MKATHIRVYCYFCRYIMVSNGACEHLKDDLIFNIFRRKYLTPDATLEEKIRIKLSGPCGYIGYREMWKRLNSKHQVRASKTKVMKLLQR